MLLSWAAVCPSMSLVRRKKYPVAIIKKRGNTTFSDNHRFSKVVLPIAASYLLPYQPSRVAVSNTCPFMA